MSTRSSSRITSVKTKADFAATAVIVAAPLASRKGTLKRHDLSRLLADATQKASSGTESMSALWKVTATVAMSHGKVLVRRAGNGTIPRRRAIRARRLPILSSIELCEILDRYTGLYLD